jgi:hypothetical protein
MDNLDRIRAHLRKRDSMFFIKTYAQIAVGAIASLMAPAAILIFSLIICRLWRWDWSWWIILLTAGLSLAELIGLFRQEGQAQGGLLNDVRDSFNRAAFAKESAPSFKHVGLLGDALVRPRTPLTGLAEFFLIGPNLVVSSLRKLRLRELSKGADPERIVKVVDTLCKLQGGAATDKMREEKETPQQFSRVLAYLLFFDWIGIADDGSKAWMLTEARKELARKE